MIALLLTAVFVLTSCSGGPGGVSFPSTANAATMGATLTWVSPATNTDGTALTNLAGFNVYSSSTHGGPYTRIGLTTATVLTYTDSVSVPDNTIVTKFYVVTAYNTNGNESGYSNEVTKSFTGNNTLAPNPPQNLTTS